MKLKAVALAFVLSQFGLSGAHAQALPSVAAAWGDSKLSKETCLERGVQVFKTLNFKRVEAISFTVYADYENYQLGIRCVPDKQMYFVFGGGPGDDEKPLLKHINAVKAEMDR